MEFGNEGTGLKWERIELLFPNCNQCIQREIVTDLSPEKILANPKIIFSLLHHSTYFWLRRDRLEPVDRKGLYHLSPFQQGKYYYKITMAVPPDLEGKLELFVPGSSVPIPLTHKTFPGQYRGILIPKDLYRELLKHTIVYGGSKNEERIGLVYDGLQQDDDVSSV